MLFAPLAYQRYPAFRLDRVGLEGTRPARLVGGSRSLAKGWIESGTSVTRTALIFDPIRIVYQIETGSDVTRPARRMD